MKLHLATALIFLTTDQTESHGGGFCSLDKVLIGGSQSQTSPNTSLRQCFSLCGGRRDCEYWSWQSDSRTCTTMRDFTRMERSRSGVAGSRRCPGNAQ